MGPKAGLWPLQPPDARRDNAYAHHSQCLMVAGNFALLAVYAAAVEWVELPNAYGMVLHAGGGWVGSKPLPRRGLYPADVQPLRPGGNARMALACRNPDRMPETARVRVQADAARFWARADHWAARSHQHRLPLDLP